MAARKRKVLFLCTGNSARSQMAEAFLRKRAGHAFEVASAGLQPREIHPMTYQVMGEIGVDLKGHRSKSIDDIHGVGTVLYVIFVCSAAEQACPQTFAPAAVRLSWPFDDPSAASGDESTRLLKFREVRDQIKQRIETWLAEEVPVNWLAHGG